MVEIVREEYSPEEFKKQINSKLVSLKREINTAQLSLKQGLISGRNKDLEEFDKEITALISDAKDIIYKIQDKLF